MSDSETEINEITTHTRALKRLKFKDPEFYQFLEQNDKDLLDFQDSKDESDVEADDGESEQTVITASNFKIIKKRLQEKPSVKVCKTLVTTFKELVILTESDEFTDMGMSDIFNDVVKLCIVDLVPAFYKVLKVDPNSRNKKKSDPTSSKGWKSMCMCFKSYLTSFLKILSVLKEPSVLKLLLKHVVHLLPFYLKFPKLVKLLMKKVISLWSTEEETVRVVAFFAIMRTVKASPEYLSIVSKNMYFTYVQNTKFTSPSTWPLINFMKQTLVQIYLLDPEVAYEQLFVYIRQLSIHLRNALITKKTDATQIVTNWQFVHCLFLWSELLCALHKSDVIMTLVYPLVQVIIGTITLCPTLKYVPLRFHLIRCLIQITGATGKFIPVLPLILDVLTITDFNKRSVFKATVTNLKCSLKVGKSQLLETGFRDGCIVEVCTLLMEYLKFYSHTISFPELVLPASAQIRAFMKKCKITKYNHQLKAILVKITENSEFMSDKRKEVNFKITDEEKIEEFERKILEQGTVIFRPTKVKTVDVEEANPNKKRKLGV